ncbi:hypothetical protein BSK59_12985 [Paenibacillus odorifer]|uniref:hypothetical protein n=1 Tax=Paenibacillus odorifer TaxID=189426 RepID=UPI00096FC8DD|nr:hypothetical protein [Paenibacillus odorifer]OME55389.1 hypothetical protein BSK59_12985 [Paenibacillus odorifer]
MKDYKNYHTSSTSKILSDAKVISEITFRGLESQEILINGNIETTIFFYDKTSSSASLKYVIDKKNLVTYGDVLYLKNGQKWIVTTYDTENYLYTRWVSRLSQFDLRWIDDTSTVHSYPCILEYNTKSNFGEKEDKVMSIPDGRRQVIIRKDEHSIKLNRSKRFIIGNEAFEVVDYDFISDFGLVNLSLKSSQIDPSKDNIELEIADYQNNLNKYTLEFKSLESLSINLNQKIRLDVLATKNTIPVDVHEIHLSSADSTIGTVDCDGYFTSSKTGKVKIFAEYQGLHDSVEIMVRDIQVNNYSVDIVGSDAITLGQKQDYKVIFRNNGMEINEDLIVFLTDEDGYSITKKAKIETETNNVITVRADNKNMGYVLLSARSKNGLMSGNKKIRIKGFL